MSTDPTRGAPAAGPGAGSGASPAVTKAEREAVVLDAKDLPAFCPNPNMPLWNHHPKVFLDLSHTGSAACPYCGTRYRLAPGVKTGTH